MNPQQKSLTLAFLVVFGSITIRNNWYERFKVWVTKSPDAAKVAAAATTKPQYGLRNWQAAIGMYIILMALSETKLEPLVPPVAWGIALIEFLTAVPTAEQTYPKLFSGASTLVPIPQNTPSLLSQPASSTPITLGPQGVLPDSALPGQTTATQSLTSRYRTVADVADALARGQITEQQFNQWFIDSQNGR